MISVFRRLPLRDLNDVRRWWHRPVFRSARGLAVLQQVDHGVMIAYRHWPWSVTWSWLFKVVKVPRHHYGRVWYAGIHRPYNRDCGGWTVYLPVGFRVAFLRQPEQPHRPHPDAARRARIRPVMEPLGAEFEAVWNANVDKLHEP